MKTHQEIITLAAAIAPSLAIETIWEHDSSPDESIFEAGNALEDEDPTNWEAWASEVRATAIVGGKLVIGTDCLGGTWEKDGDDPQESNPDISGYFPHMLGEALRWLINEISNASTEPQSRGQAVGLKREINALRAAIN